MVFRNYSFKWLLAGLALAVPLQSQIVTTVAGNSTWGQVWHSVIDAGGNLYVADSTKNVVYKVTTTGVTTTVAGTGTAGYSGDGGQASAATLRTPYDVAVAPDGTLYISDGNNECIRKVAPNGVISTFAGSCGHAGFAGDGKASTSAMMNVPFTMQLDSKGNLYFVDYQNHRIREITTDGNINTIAGSGNGATVAEADGSLAPSTNMTPGYIALGPDGTLYYSDDGNPNAGVPRVRKIDPKTNMVTTVAGNGTRAYAGDGGPATKASFVTADGIALDSAGDIYIADWGNARIRKVSADGTIATYAGTGSGGYTGDGGPALSATFNGPTGLYSDSLNNIYVADLNNMRIRKISSVPTVSMSGVVNGASFVSGALVPGEIATVFGTNLTFSNGINLAASLPLATNLLNVQVMVNGTAAPIFAVDNVNGQQQINFQVPYEIAGLSSATVQVIDNGAAGNTVTVPVVTAQPGVFTYTVGNTTFGAILHANYALANTSSPATANETVLIYCTGLGVVTPSATDGAAAVGASQTMAAPTVTMGGVQSQISYSGLAPGFVGLYQINAVVPMGVPSGNQPVIITINGTQSSIALLPIM
jgi:uncharacterized protein (TIGR03437 family)